MTGTSDVTVVIATLFHPPTLKPLVEAIEAQGASAIVVEGQLTNHAWNDGIHQAGTRYVVVANDDIEVLPDDWIERLLAHHAAGFSYVNVPLWRKLERMRKALGPDVNCSMVDEPADKGHLFSLDTDLGVPPIPEDLRLWHGDDWFYWQHRSRGRACVCLDVSLKTGFDLGFEGPSGWTQKQPQFEDAIGTSMVEVSRGDHRAARRYFILPDDGKDCSWYARQVDWCGRAVGIQPRELYA